MNKPLFPDVIVNGETISAVQVAAEAQNHTAPTGKPGLAWRKAAQALVVRTLLLQEAARLGLEASPEVVGPGKLETEDEALIRQVLEDGVDPKQPDAAAIRRVYDADPGQFRAPSLYEPAHILIPVAPKAPEEDVVAAQGLAAKLITTLQTKPKAFGDLAAEHSACSSRDNGGRLGQISTGDTVPEFEAAMDAMDEGTLGPQPLRTRYGMHILRLDAKSAGKILPFDAVAPRIEEALEKAGWTYAARDYVDRLVSQAEISGIDMIAGREASGA